MRLFQNIRQTQSLKLRHVLSHKMIQMLRISHMAYEELLEAVERESEQNVFVEVQRFDRLCNAGPIGSGTDMGDDDDPRTRVVDIRRKPLCEVLQDQLNLESMETLDRRIALALIEAIDLRGYISDYPVLSQSIVQAVGVSLSDVERVLKRIQNFEPDGVGARSLEECLLIQLHQHGFEDESLVELLDRFITHHLQNAAEHHFSTIATDLKIPEAGVEPLIEFVKVNLTPNPGLAYGADDCNRMVVPSFEARIDGDGTLGLENLEATQGVQVGMSKQYVAMLADPALDAQTRTFLEKQRESAQTFVENIQKRRENIDRLASFIVTKQALFIRSGALFLNPLLQKTVAQSLGITPSTVSRIVASKYIRTPHGVFLFKSLCPREVFGHTPERLQKMVQTLATQHPTMSDQALTDLLNEAGIGIARRTVNKYRRVDFEA